MATDVETFGPGRPNPEPGYYYVTVVDGPRFAFLLGPYVNDHARALAAVDAAKKWCHDRREEAWFWSFGTCRLKDEHTDEANLPMGKLNDQLELADVTPAEAGWVCWRP